MTSTTNDILNPNFRTRFLPVFALSLGLTLGLTACKSTAPLGPDPAAANLAPVAQPLNQPPASGQPQYPSPQYGNQPTRVLGQSSAYAPQQNGEEYDEYADNNRRGQGVYDEADQPPPPQRNYQQPPAPGAGYLWTPGYWGHNPSGYSWVQGAWARPPFQRALWTPGYWHSNGHRYDWHPGYWGPHVGYYGGIDYGNGYVGTGYYGGYWNKDNFYYNRAYNTLPSGITSLYERPAIYNNVTYGRDIVASLSFNGPGGVLIGPRPYEIVAMHERHSPAYPGQFREQREVYVDRNTYGPHVIVNHGHPEGFIPPGQQRKFERQNEDQGNGKGHGHGENGEGHHNDKGKGHGHGDDGEGHEKGNGKGHGKGRD